MGRRIRWLMLAGAFFWGVAACAVQGPFTVSRSEIYKRIKTVALVPLVLPKPLRIDRAVTGRVEQKIEVSLREAGFQVIPAVEFETIWQRQSEKVGALFDPKTGLRDEPRFDSVRRESRREVKERFGADALLLCSVEVVTVQFMNTLAAWDGVSDVVVPSRTERALQAFSGFHSSGTVPGLSLCLDLQHVDGGSLYRGRGGVQLLSKLTGGRFVTVPDRDLLADDERISGAVEAALKALVNEPVTLNSGRNTP
jgi:hypothetical protein